MTGRELIIYILANGLEDEPVIKDGKFVGFISIEELAVHLEVGLATADMMAEISGWTRVRIGDRVYVPRTQVFGFK